MSSSNAGPYTRSTCGWKSTSDRSCMRLPAVLFKYVRKTVEASCRTASSGLRRGKRTAHQGALITRANNSLVSSNSAMPAASSSNSIMWLLPMSLKAHPSGMMQGPYTHPMRNDKLFLPVHPKRVLVLASSAPLKLTSSPAILNVHSADFKATIYHKLFTVQNWLRLPGR